MAEWHNYPLTIDASLHNPYLFDAEYSAQLLNTHAQRLFKPNNELHIKVIEVNVKDYIFTSFLEFDKYLFQSNFLGTRLFLIPQEFSWGQLKISEDGIKALFHRIKVFPAAMDVLCAFGKQTSNMSDSLGSFYSYSEGGVSEYCYLTKMVEEHGRSGADEPWSIRQMGVYHRQETRTGSNNFVIFNPTRSFQQRLKKAQYHPKATLTSNNIHTLLLSHCTWQWKWYLTYWESKLSNLISKAHLSQAERPRDTELGLTLKIEYSDVQDVQVIHDRMSTTKFVLGSNLRICELLPDVSVELLSTELKQQFNRADNILEKTKSASALMQDILSFGGLDALRRSNEMAEMDNRNMVKLTTKSQKDAHTLKKITILTMVYLPAAFVSQFLSMGYVEVNTMSHPPTLKFSSEMWVFGVLTLTLFAVTLGLWLFLDRLSSRWKWWRSGENSRGRTHEENV